MNVQFCAVYIATCHLAWKGIGRNINACSGEKEGRSGLMDKLATCKELVWLHVTTQLHGYLPKLGYFYHYHISRGVSQSLL